MAKTGQILSELLIALAIGVVLALVGAQLVAVSLNATRTSQGRSEASGLVQEGIEALRAIAYGNDSLSQGWNRIYQPPAGSGATSTSKGFLNPYHPAIVSEQWQLASGEEIVILSGISYTRKVFIENVCRSDATKDIAGTAPCAAGTSDDPSTQKITVIVSRNGEPDAALSEFFSRYGNEASPQTAWTGSQNCNPVGATSSPTSYCSQTCIDRTGGSLQLTTGC